MGAVRDCRLKRNIQVICNFFGGAAFRNQSQYFDFALSKAAEIRMFVLSDGVRGMLARPDGVQRFSQYAARFGDLVPVQGPVLQHAIELIAGLPKVVE